MTPLLFPSLHPTPKKIYKLKRFKVHVTGIINHTFGTRYLYHFPSEYYEHGANLTCSLLFHHLKELKLEGRAIPSQLQIQFDNCWRENKNITVFGFAAYLVQIGLFESVLFSSLIQGHTHEDVDQMFSNLSKAYWSKNCYTYSEFPNLIDRAYSSNSKPSSRRIEEIYDFKSFFEGKVCSMEGHSKGRVFTFYRHQSLVVMKYKELSSQEWQGFTVEGDDTTQYPI
jgi:hypothetical protein